MGNYGALLLTAGVLLFLTLAYYRFEKSPFDTKEIALLATLSAFAAISRIPFAAIPNVQPTTFIVALTGYVFGPFQGFLVGSTTALLSNIFLGQGPWTPWQMLAWGLVGALSGFLGKRKNTLSVLSFSLLCFFFGFFFDWVMNLWFVVGYIRPLNLKTIGIAYLTGLSVDIMHGVGNYAFSLLLYEGFRTVLMRFKRRLHTTTIKELPKEDFHHESL